MTYNINNPEAVVNIESAHTVNITQAKAVNLGGFVGVGEPFTPSDWHEEECKLWITSRDIPENAPCICPEVRAAYRRGRADAAKAVEAIHCPNPHGYIYPPGDGEAEDAIVCDSCWDGEYRLDIYPCETLLAARGESEQT